jgi:UDP-N-acetylmuramyl pentapeptide phosphotransferase/UDP-N-acetylglucosamine-1-phosphate transferase
MFDSAFNIIFYFFLILFLGILLNFLLIKNYKVLNLSVFLDADFKKPQAFHEQKILRVGGISFYIIFSIIIFYISSKIFYDLFFLVSACFFVGLIDDVKLSNSPRLRLTLLFFLINFLIIIFNIETPQFQIFYIDIILSESKWLRFFLLSICFLIIINGSNFIDGYNGLLLGQFSIILIILNFINYYYFNSELLFLGTSFLAITLSLLFFNFPKARLFLGDSGSYLIGATLSYLLIKTSASTKLFIPPFFFGCLIYYISFEVIFSFFRKIMIEKKNPFYPDSNHLHMLLFKYFKKKNILIKANYKTGLSTNLIYLISLFPLIFFYQNLFFLKIYFFLLLLFYLVLYSSMRYIFLKK